MDIHVLDRQGNSIRAIAKELGVSRNIRRYLRDLTAAPIYLTGPEPRPMKLGPYQSYVGDRIEAAKPHWIPASVLIEEIRALGCNGGATGLRSYVTGFKPTNTDPLVL